MILIVFAVFLSVTILLFIIGKLLNAPVVSLAGSGFLFVLGLTLMFGSLAYSTGYTELYVYGDNYDGYHYDDYNGTTKVSDLNLFHMNHTKTYEIYDSEIISGLQVNHILGFLLTLIGIFSFIIILANVRGWNF